MIARACPLPAVTGTQHISLVDAAHGPRRLDIYVQGSVVARSFGGADGRQQTSTKTYESPALAVRSVAAALTRLRLRGYVDGVRNAELEAAIAAAPDEPSHYLIYADYLADHGDARGELISVATALDERPDDVQLLARERELFARHPFALADPRWRSLSLVWRCGHVEGLRTDIELERWFELEGGGALPQRLPQNPYYGRAADVAEQLARIRHHPMGAYVRRVYSPGGVFTVRHRKLTTRNNTRNYGLRSYEWELVRTA